MSPIKARIDQQQPSECNSLWYFPHNRKGFLRNLNDFSGRRIVIKDRVVTFSPDCVAQNAQYDMLNISIHSFVYIMLPTRKLVKLAASAYKVVSPLAFSPSLSSSFLRRVIL